MKILSEAYSRGWYYFVVEDIGYDWKYLYSKKVYVCKKAEGAIVFKTAEIYKSRVETLLEIAHRRWKDALESYTSRDPGDGIWWNFDRA